jgi:hypothetical protein
VNTKTFLIILASAFGLIIIGAVVCGVMESRGMLTEETIGQKGITAIKIIYFALFCIICFAVVPIVIRYFIVLQIKIGNEGLFLIQWLQTHERAVIYGAWSIFIIGLCISLSAAIKEGFFK